MKVLFGIYMVLVVSMFIYVGIVCIRNSLTDPYIIGYAVPKYADRHEQNARDKQENNRRQRDGR